MGIVKLLLLILLPAIALGCIIGVVLGKHQVKKASGQLHSLLSPRQKIVYGASLVFGIACILVAVLYNPAPKDEFGMDGDFDMDGIGVFNPEYGMDDGFVMEGDFDDSMLRSGDLDDDFLDDGSGEEMLPDADGEPEGEAMAEAEADVPAATGSGRSTARSGGSVRIRGGGSGVVVMR